MHAIKKWTAAFLLLIILAGLPGLPAAAAPGVELELSARAAVLIEAETGAVLYAKNAAEPLPPASLTKIMTLLLAMEELKRGVVDWDTVITVSTRAWEASMGGEASTMFLNINQQVTLEELIKGIAIISAGDACVAVAEHLYGSEVAFVQKMNQRAAELGLANTNFVNSHGLHDPDQYMSALDVARLAAFFVQTQPEAAAFQSEREFTFNGIKQFNRNPLLGRYPGADGIKTGYTPQAGYNLASTSRQNGMRLVSVVMGTPGDEARALDSEVLLNYGFREFTLATLYEPGAVVASVPVNRGRKRTLDLVANRPVKAAVPRGESGDSIGRRLELPAAVSAPVQAGESVGMLYLVDPSGETLGGFELFAAEKVERLGLIPFVFRSIGDFFAGLWRRGRNGGE